MIVVFVGAVGAGGALSYMLGQIRPVFGSARTLRKFAELPVLGSVSFAWPERLRAEQMAEMKRFGLSFSALFLVFIALSVIEKLGPGIYFSIS
jgi:hypothetical protein